MTEQALRALADAGAPSVLAPPFLAERVLALRARSRLRRRIGVSLALLGLITGATVAARSEGTARFYEVYMPSASMQPTLGIGENLIADRTLEPARDDVVELSFRNSGTGLAVKRIIGLPGDVIGCPPGPDGFCHAWTRNGEALSEPWIGRELVEPASPAGAQPGFFVARSDRIVPFPSVTVTPGHVFLLGDNRDNSVDSRNSHPALQELAAIQGVGVQVVGTDGRRRPIPGAPRHAVPGPGGAVDPPAGPPTANSTVPANG